MREWKLEPARDLGLPLKQRLRSQRREAGLIETAAHLSWWGLVRGYLRAWHGFTVVGAENLPAEPPFVLVANHASHLDALVLAAPLPWRLRDRVFPIAAGDTFFENPAKALFAVGFINALPIWRKKCGPHALQQLRQRLVEEPCVYILFPEGTRCRDGKMTRFKPGLGMLVAGAAVPIVPCYLDGTFEALPPHCVRPRCEQIMVRIGKPLHFPTAGNDRAGWEAIAHGMEAAVRELAGDKETPATVADAGSV